VPQDAFIKAHKHFSRLRQRDSFRAWLVRTAWRLAIDRQRANSRRVRRESEHARLTQEASHSGFMSDDVWRIIDRLPDKLRLTLTLAPEPLGPTRKLTMTELTIAPIPIEPLVLSEQQGVVQ
jgi:DNA-directed RNA polymerase specialized sigma24 family protein